MESLRELELCLMQEVRARGGELYVFADGIRQLRPRNMCTSSDCRKTTGIFRLCYT